MAQQPRRLIGNANAAPSRTQQSYRNANYNQGPQPSQRFSPFSEIGTSGVAVFGGRPISREKNTLVSGPMRWITYADLVANTSIVAAGVRYFLNIVAHAKWTVTPASDKPEAQEVSEFIDSVINSMNTPWRNVARRAAMYRFNGFGIQEWTAKRRKEDSKIGLDDIESRPAHTIERWQIDDKGSIIGVWQLSPQTSEYLYLPRGKTLYLVEDSLTDSPEGLGLFRHLIGPYQRLNRYLTLEGRGFERDLRGIPVARLPYSALQASVKAGIMTETEANNIKFALEEFVKMQTTSEDTSICIDSAPYVVDTDSGRQISGVPQYGLELLTGQTPDFPGLATAIQRINEEMARVIGTEHLMLGGAGAANRALSEDKSRNFYLTVNGSLDDIVDGANKDVVNPICDLNGIGEDLRPKVTHSDVSFKSVSEITAALRDMATAGAVLAPDDPAIEDVRDILGISKPPEMTPERMGLLGKQPEDHPDHPAAGEGPDERQARETEAATAAAALNGPGVRPKGGGLARRSGRDSGSSRMSQGR